MFEDPADEIALLSRRMLLGGGIAFGAAAALPTFAASTTSTAGLPREMGIPADEKSRIDIIRDRKSVV